MLSKTIMKPSTVTARVVGGNRLVGVFRKSLPPTVWQFDVEKNAGFSLVWQAEGEGWSLVVASPREVPVSVARFPHREDAEGAWECVQKALIKGDRSRGFRLRWGWVIAGLVLVALVVFVGGALKGTRTGMADSQAALLQMEPAFGAGMAKSELEPVEIRNGVPLTADDVLKMPGGR